MAVSRLNPTELVFTSNGTDVNAQLTASNDTLTLFSTGGANNSVAINNASAFQIIGSTSGTITQQASGTTTSYTVTWPNAVGAANQVLATDASGILSWEDASSTPAAGGSGDIQYNSGTNTFAAASTSAFTFIDGIGSILEVGVEDGQFTVVSAPAVTATLSGSAISLLSGDGATTGDGGEISFATGAGGNSAGGNGGKLLINTGLSGTGSTGNGGDFNILTGSAQSTNGNGGNMNITMGSGNGTGVDGIFTINGDTPSTSVSTGTVIISGSSAGLGVEGDIYCNTVFSTSDVNMKKNISRISNPLDKLLKIEGYTYDWKNEKLNQPGKKNWGVLAQQLETIGLADMVSGDKENQMAVNYLSLIPLLIEAVKEMANDLYEQ